MDEDIANKVRRDAERRDKQDKADRQEYLSYLVGGECGVEGNGFAVWIGDRDLLRAGVEAGSNDEESVGVLECDDGGFSLGADGGAALESAVADGESGAAHGGNRCGRNRADSQGTAASWTMVKAAFVACRLKK